MQVGHVKMVSDRLAKHAISRYDTDRL